MDTTRLITVAVAAAMLLLSLPSIAWAEPIEPANRAAYGSEIWANEQEPIFADQGIEVGTIGTAASTLAELDFEPGVAEELNLSPSVPDGYYQRIEAAASTAPVAPAYDVEAYWARIEAAANTAPVAPQWEQQEAPKQPSVRGPMTRHNVQ